MGIRKGEGFMEEDPLFERADKIYYMLEFY